MCEIDVVNVASIHCLLLPLGCHDATQAREESGAPTISLAVWSPFLCDEALAEAVHWDIGEQGGREGAARGGDGGNGRPGGGGRSGRGGGGAGGGDGGSKLEVLGPGAGTGVDMGAGGPHPPNSLASTRAGSRSMFVQGDAIPRFSTAHCSNPAPELCSTSARPSGAVKRRREHRKALWGVTKELEFSFNSFQ